MNVAQNNRKRPKGLSFFIASEQVKNYLDEVVERRDDCTNYETCLFNFEGRTRAYCPKECEHYKEWKPRIESYMSSNRSNWDTVE
jgi:hypothetical protein